MNKEEAIKYVEAFEGDILEIITPEKAMENEFFKSEINKATGKAYQEVDSVLNELGLDKQGKTSDTVKFHFTGFSQKMEKLTGVEKYNSKLLEQIEDLKQNGATDETLKLDLEKYKKQVVELKDIREKEKNEYTTTIEEKNKSIENTHINRLLKEALPKDLKHDDADYLTHKIAVSINDIKEKYKVSITDGKLVISSKDNSFENFNADSLLKDSLKSLVSATPDLGGKKPNGNIKLSNATTKNELMDAVELQVATEGLSPLDNAFYTRKQELLKENNYETLK